MGTRPARGHYNGLGEGVEASCRRRGWESQGWDGEAQGHPV